MNITETIGKAIGFSLAVVIFSLIISFIRGNIAVKTTIFFAVSTAVVVVILAWLFSLSEQKKVEDVS